MLGTAVSASAAAGPRKRNDEGELGDSETSGCGTADA